LKKFVLSHGVEAEYPAGGWKVLKQLLRGLMLLAGLLTSATHAENRLLNITVVADHTKANGEPWDGLPGLGGGRGPAFLPIPNLNAPPDLALCIVRAGTPPDCLLRREGRKQYSFCQNAYDCTFSRVSIPDQLFGLIILDLDLVHHDLVDFVIVIPESGATQDEIDRLDKDLRAEVAKLAPAFTDGERQRRLRTTLRLPIDQWVGAGKACRLVQSEIRMDWAR
jgi:hypothetical protein